MKKMMIILVGVLVACVSMAGKIDVGNPVAVKAAQKIKANADASVTFAQIKDNIEQVGIALDAIDLGSITNTVFTGDQRTAVKNIKDSMASLKAASKNLMQASNQLVRKMKETERIQKEARQ